MFYRNTDSMYKLVWIAKEAHGAVSFLSLLSATSIKSQVCDVVRIIRRSLYQIHALFYFHIESGETKLEGQFLSIHYIIQKHKE